MYAKYVNADWLKKASPIIGIDDSTGTSNALNGTILGGVVLNGISIVYA